MKLYDLQVNHLTNPLGFRMENTIFSWKVGEARGKYQEAARLQVFAGASLEQPVYDSGWDRAADSLACSANLNLKPRTRYYWTVSVRSDAGEEETSEVQWFETAKMQEPWVGKWITCDSAKERFPIFKKNIFPKREVACARLYICGLGLYEAYLNGEKVGNEFLTPYSNDYHEWIQYQTYDVTEQIQENTTLSVLLGNGWYKGRFGILPQTGEGFYGTRWMLIAELRLIYADGSEEVIGTDASWSVARSSIVSASLYDGEIRDDTLPETAEEMAVVCDSGCGLEEAYEMPRGRLTARMSLPVTERERLLPAELIRTPAGETVLDLGQEFAGIFRLHVKEPAGTKIHIQTGEILQQGNFYNENLRSAKSEYIYISDGNERWIIPHFTYYGYRYVKIEGISDLKKEDFIGIALYSGFMDTGWIETGHDLVNRFFSNVRWGLKSNFLDVPTDCPQRDERMGWTGDAQVFSGTACYLEDTYAFYAKFLYDLAKEQEALGGKVPDVIPSVGVETCSSVWGDAACMIPWNLYCFYGDQQILKDQFASMKGWVDYMERVDGADHGWRRARHYGDWLALDHPSGRRDELLGGTDIGFIADVYYAASAGIVSEAAKILGLEEEARRYGALSRIQFDHVRKEYFSQTGRCCIRTQTALLLALKYDLSDNVKLTRDTLRELFEENNYKLKTGFVGTSLLCNVLSEHGMEDIAWKLFLNEGYPGWLREVKLGATTVWERWNSVEDDGNVSGSGMNSLNHYSYGSVVEWMFRHIAGIRPVEKPGFREAGIAPSLNWYLKTMEVVYDSAAGKYKIAWKILDERHVELSVEIPFGCRARLTLPLPTEETFLMKENPMFEEVRDGICYLQPGRYTVRYETARPLKPRQDLDTPLQELYSNPRIGEKMQAVVPLETIPLRHMKYTVREIGKRAGQYVSEEQVHKIEEVLRENKL